MKNRCRRETEKICQCLNNEKFLNRPRAARTITPSWPWPAFCILFFRYSAFAASLLCDVTGAVVNGHCGWRWIGRRGRGGALAVRCVLSNLQVSFFGCAPVVCRLGCFFLIGTLISEHKGRGSLQFCAVWEESLVTGPGARLGDKGGAAAYVSGGLFLPLAILCWVCAVCGFCPSKGITKEEGGQKRGRPTAHCIVCAGVYARR